MPSDLLSRLGKVSRKVESLHDRYSKGQIDEEYLDDLMWAKNQLDKMWYELEPQVSGGG